MVLRAAGRDRRPIVRFPMRRLPEWWVKRSIVLVVLAIFVPMSAALSGCAKQPAPEAMHSAVVAPSQATVPHAEPNAVKDASPPAEEPALPGDPITNAPPMPVALLKTKKTGAIASATRALPATGVGFRGSIDAGSDRLHTGNLGSNQAFLTGNSSLFTSSDPVWAPVPTVYTDDHLPPDTIAVIEEADPYLLDAGDRVRVFVYGQPNLSRTYPIDVAGSIAIPLIGAVKARGSTVRELKLRIVRALGVKYVRNPEVSVEVAQYRPFFILGEVRNAGQFAWVNGMTIQTAVAIAGGYSPRATQRSVRVQRRVDGVLSEIDVPTSFAVKPGDTIYVQERFF